MAATSLNQLRPGERARVAAIGADGRAIRRLIENGLLPGTELRLIRRAPLGDPIEIRLRGYSLTLRAQDAAQISVQRLP